MRFSIRDVLWMTALVAALVAWGLDRTLLARQVSQLQKEAAVWEGASKEFWQSLVDAAHYIASLKQNSGATHPNDGYWKLLHDSDSK